MAQTRTILCKGDMAGQATIIEGLANMTISDGGAQRQVATLYMKTYCNTCKREGFVAPTGSRNPGRMENGQPWALDGDINVCNCNPAPVYHAQRFMVETVGGGSEQLKAAAEAIRKASPEKLPHSGRFHLRDSTGNSLPETYYSVRLPSGELKHGITDAEGYTGRYQTDDPQSLHFFVGHKEA